MKRGVANEKNKVASFGYFLHFVVVEDFELFASWCRTQAASLPVLSW
jgi:hypothetical protein